MLAGNAGGGFGCGGAQSAAGMPPSTPVTVDVPQQWVALKSRFFVNVFSSDVPNSGFSAAMVRDTTRQTYLLHELRARVSYRGQTVAQGESVAREYTLFIGPKKLDPEVERRYRDALGYSGEIERMERFAFYERAKKAYAVVLTGETAKYGNIILKKGVTPVA